MFACMVSAKSMTFPVYFITLSHIYENLPSDERKTSLNSCIVSQAFIATRHQSSVGWDKLKQTDYNFFSITLFQFVIKFLLQLKCFSWFCSQILPFPQMYFSFQNNFSKLS